MQEIRPSPNISISTAWNSIRHKSGRKMVQELLDIGFDTLELDVHVTQSMIVEIQRMVDHHAVNISSLHNFCPLPKGVRSEDTNRTPFSLSSLDESMRSRAVEQTKNTIDWAVRLGSSLVVLHTGSVDMERRQRDALRYLGANYHVQAAQIVAEDLEKRESICMPYVDAVIASLHELSAYAEASGVRLGLETRYYYIEIPSFDEFQLIFDSVPSPSLGFWYDSGHVHVQEALGIVGKGEYLRRYGDRLIGMHAHNAVVGSDHRAIGRGEIDFAEIMPYIRPDAQIVMEIHGQATPQELIRSMEILRQLSDNT